MTGRCRYVPGRRNPAAGSATVELVFIVPFVLITLAAVWDLRQYISYRTELAREMYVVAEAVADQPGGPVPFGHAIGEAVLRLQENARAGVVQAAVVVRGTQRPDGSDCPPDEWCLPRVSAAWPTPGDSTAGRWSDAGGNACAAVANPLPAAGEHFESEQKLLPHEGADPDADGPRAAPAEEDWISRTLSETEWWVVVDTCVDPQPGLFIGRMTNAAAGMLDTSFALRRRAVWGSIHDRADCDWCG